METIKDAQQSFDLIVHRRDTKTGRVTEVAPYRLFVKDGVEYFERPKGSGNLFFRNNEVAGRMVDGSVKASAEHVAWVAPLNADQKLAQQSAAQAEEIRKLQLELDAMKREKKFGKSTDSMKKVLGDSEKENNKEVK